MEVSPSMVVEMSVERVREWTTAAASSFPFGSRATRGSRVAARSAKIAGGRL